MAVDYVCAVNKDHPKKTFALPQNQLPMCCGKPMRLVASVPQPVATPAQPAGATAAKPQPLAKPSYQKPTPQQPQKGTPPKK
jgi:hypothetical protein